MSSYVRLCLAITVSAALTGSALVIASSQQPSAPPPSGEEAVTQLKETRICKRCDLSGANLMGADLYGAQLQEATLSGAALNDANLEMANLRGAVGADFTGARTDKRTTCPDGSMGPCK